MGKLCLLYNWIPTFWQCPFFQDSNKNLNIRKRIVIFHHSNDHTFLLTFHCGNNEWYLLIFCFRPKKLSYCLIIINKINFGITLLLTVTVISKLTNWNFFFKLILWTKHKNVIRRKYILYFFLKIFEAIHSTVGGNQPINPLRV